MARDKPRRDAAAFRHQNGLGGSLAAQPDPGLIERLAQPPGKMRIEVEPAVLEALARDLLKNRDILGTGQPRRPAAPNAWTGKVSTESHPDIDQVKAVLF